MKKSLYFLRDLFIPRPKSKIDRVNDFMRDMAKVYQKHSNHLSVKEMHVFSKERTSQSGFIQSSVRGKK